MTSFDVFFNGYLLILIFIDFNSMFSLLGIFKAISAILLVGLAAWAYQGLQPPAPKICGAPDGPSITAPRIQLKDGRYLAYKELGVPKDEAKYKVVFVHAFDSCRHDASLFLPEKTAEELGIYLVSFDRAGYGESTPNLKCTLKSTALDVEELADQLDLGSKFHVMGFSIGGQVIWTCLKYIPHRYDKILAGATLIAPAINYWWPGFSRNLSAVVYRQLLVQDQFALRVAHYFSWLTYWWNTQKLWPSFGAIVRNPDVFSAADRELFPMLAKRRKSYLEIVRQQGEFHSLHSDLNIGFGKWEFDPSDLENPFPNNEASVHIWQGDGDLLVPVSLQRYIAGKLPWINYHELNGPGHLLYSDGIPDAILKAAFLQEK
ncbi:hypothetical protein Syun_002560 [Stephania yunnanensis]|uniref:AB hydrolase-1 domain-containing protein n=1 Tax=Stephania yunnanensis TaxID=152371 RepID=A0AAP0LGN3_9MAGN